MRPRGRTPSASGWRRPARPPPPGRRVRARPGSRCWRAGSSSPASSCCSARRSPASPVSAVAGGPLGAGGWLLSAAGLVLLALRRSAGPRTRRSTSCCTRRSGAALDLARGRDRRRRRRRCSSPAEERAGSAGAALAGSESSPRWRRSRCTSRPGMRRRARGRTRCRSALQWAHVAAAAVWIGGLAALLYSVRGAPSPTKTRAVRRFSTVAAGGLVVVGATGLARAVEELSSVRDLVSTGYGARGAGEDRAPARDRRARRPEPLVERARGRHEPRPAAAHVERRARARRGRTRRRRGAGEPRAAGVRAGRCRRSGSRSPERTARGTVHVELTAASADPGPNRFVLRAVDDRSHAPVQRPRDAALHAARRPGRRLDVARAVAAARLRLRRLGREHGVRRPLGRDGAHPAVRAGTRDPRPARAGCAGPGASSSRSSAFRARPRSTRCRSETSATSASRRTPSAPGPSTISVTCYDVFSDVIARRSAGAHRRGGRRPDGAASACAAVGGNVSRHGVDLAARGRTPIAVVAKTVVRSAAAGGAPARRSRLSRFCATTRGCASTPPRRARRSGSRSIACAEAALGQVVGGLRPARDSRVGELVRDRPPAADGVGDRDLRPGPGRRARAMPISGWRVASGIALFGSLISLHRALRRRPSPVVEDLARRRARRRLTCVCRRSRTTG